MRQLEIAPADQLLTGFAQLDLGASLRPSWLDGPVFLPIESAAPTLAGEPLAHLAVAGRRFVAIARDGETVRFAFDPDAVLRSLATESCLPARRPFISRLPGWYQAVPGVWRLRLHGLLAGRRESETEAAGFIEPAYVALEAVLRQLRGEPAPAWPNGARYAVAFSHDVDTRRGLRSIEAIRAVESAAGVTSGWAVVADRCRGFEHLLDDLRRDGHEVLCHGARHDFRLPYLAPSAMAARFDRCRPMVERFGVQGFRSPACLMTPALRQALRALFAYDSSVPDCDVHSVLGPRRGTGLLRPTVVEGLLELPLTMPLDDRLLLLGHDARGILDTWRRKAAWLKAVGGAVVVTTHAEPHLGARPDVLAAYADLVRELAADGEAWIATPGHVAAGGGVTTSCAREAGGRKHGV